MKLAFSNIAWGRHDDPAVLDLLRSHHVGGIEVAPTKVWPQWEDAGIAAARAYRDRLLGEGFLVPALQAVLFGKPEAQLFTAEGESLFVDHLIRVAGLAEALGAGVVVLGAPRQRDPGTLEADAAMNRAAQVMLRLARVYADHGTCLCIEPNPARYGCNFVRTVREGAELVRRVDHPGFGLHLDAAGMHLEGDTIDTAWREAGSLVRHYHISEPDLAGFETPEVPHRHNLATLHDAGYPGWYSVEMREPPGRTLAEAGPWRVLPA